MTQTEKIWFVDDEPSTRFPTSDAPPYRVITNPADPGAMLPGDVLVAPITDPAWTPLFLTVRILG